MKSTKEKLAYMAKYQDTPANIKKREERNLARRTLEKQGKVAKGDGLDVDHIKMLNEGGNNKPKNWRVVTEAKNRSWRKTSPKVYGKGKK